MPHELKAKEYIMEVLAYRFFDTSEDFENWQVEEKPVICSINPLVASFDMGGTDKSDGFDARGEANARIFVVYRKNKEL